MQLSENVLIFIQPEHQEFGDFRLGWETAQSGNQRAARLLEGHMFREPGTNATSDTTHLDKIFQDEPLSAIEASGPAMQWHRSRHSATIGRNGCRRGHIDGYPQGAIGAI
jgi:hypothetical protein